MPTHPPKPIFELCMSANESDGTAAKHLYPLAEFNTWSDLDLIGFAMFAIGAVELVILHSENSKPTLVKWSIELAKVLTAVVSSRLTERPSTAGM